MIAKVEKLTELEALLFDEAYQRYGLFGFPEPRAITVVRRIFDDSGRYTFVSHPGLIEVEDGQIPLAQVELGGAKLLVVANLNIAGHSIESMEILVVGERLWKGDEPPPFILFRE